MPPFDISRELEDNLAVNTQTNNRTRRLNPFAFPSDTDFRFVLLIVSVLGASLFIYEAFYFLVPVNLEHYYVDLKCYQATKAFECFTSDARAVVEWIGLGMALLLGVAGAIYWAFPAWKIWRGGLKPLSIENAPPAMVTYLSDLCREAGLSRYPIFLLNPYSSASSGVTFGRLRRYYVSINSGLVMQFQTDRPAFQAIVLHELGHIRNADVDKTYLTISIGWAFAATALLLLGTMLFLEARHFDQILQLFFNPLFFNPLWRILCFVVLIYLIRNAILRAREVYADVRASVWDGQAGALSRVLEFLPRLKGRWQGLLLTHPDPEERCRILDNTSKLFQQGFWDIFVTGIIATSVLPNFSWLLGTWLLGQPFTGDTLLYGGPDGLGIAFALLVVGIVGLGMWRTTFANQALGEVGFNTIRVSFALTLGLLLGQILSIIASQAGYGYFTEVGIWHTTLTASLSQALVSLVLSLLLLVILFLFLRWMIVSATLWLEVAARSSSPRRTYWIAFAIASGILGIWFGRLSVILKSAQNLPDMQSLMNAVPGLLSLTPEGSVRLSIVFPLSQDPLVFLALIGLWTYPLAAWLWRKKTASVTRSSWAFLEPSSQFQTASLPYQPPFRLGLALVIGLAGGLAFCGLALLLVYGFHLSPSINDLADLAVLLQVGIAAIVAGTVRRLGTFHALFAAFVAGCIMGILIVPLLAAPLLYSGLDLDFILSTTWLVFLQVVNEGAFLSLLLALIVSVLAGWLRRLPLSDRAGV